jgi:hypothetical protein
LLPVPIAIGILLSSFVATLLSSSVHYSAQAYVLTL